MNARFEHPAPAWPLASLRSGITTHDKDVLTHWLEWGQEGDVIRYIRFPKETYQLHPEALTPGRQFFLSLVLNHGDLALIRAPGRNLVLMTEETFHELTLAGDACEPL